MLRPFFCIIWLALAPAVTAEFVDRTADLELEMDEHGTISWVDIDNDGWVDLYHGHTWRNENGKRFAKLPHKHRRPAVFGDYDNDGFVDSFGPSPTSKTGLLHRQDGKSGEFKPQPFPTLPMDWTMCQVWVDLNSDSYLDLYIGGGRKGDIDAVFMNQGGKTFTGYEIGGRLYTRGVAACDYDEDHDMDLFVSRYWFQPNHLFNNDGTGKLTDICGPAGVCGAGHTISSAWADLDNDGHFDIFACNFNHHDNRRSEDAMLYRNLGAEGGWKFKVAGTFGGDKWQESFASCALADYDNDGDVDIFITTVYPGNHARLFRNDGNWTFVNVTDAEGLGGIGTPGNYQAAWGDYDHDGDVDLVTAGRLYENQGNENHWVSVTLIGNGRTVNRSAIGSQVRIDVPPLGTLVRQVEGGFGQQNQNDMTLHFGLGTHKADVDLRITWPDGTTRTVRTPVDTRVTVVQE